jgi:hypothetical protein
LGLQVTFANAVCQLCRTSAESAAGLAWLGVAIQPLPGRPSKLERQNVHKGSSTPHGVLHGFYTSKDLTVDYNMVHMLIRAEVAGTRL